MYGNNRPVDHWNHTLTYRAPGSYDCLEQIRQFAWCDDEIISSLDFRRTVEVVMVQPRG